MTARTHSPIVQIVPFLVVVCLFSFTAQAKYSGGSGTAQDPYQIATAADLIALGETPGDYDKHFLLTADIDLDPNLPGRKVFDKGVIAATPSYAGGTPFTGVFDGDHHTISHLTIVGRAYLGLFGLLEDQGEVANLGVMDMRVVGSHGYVAGLVGHNSGTVKQCYSSGTVNGITYVGGLIGRNYGVVTLCYSTGAVSGEEHVGGLIGSSANYETVTHCYSTAAVTGVSHVGGLAGGATSLRWCYSTGAVTGTGKDVGGLLGSGYGAMASVWDMQTSGQASSQSGIGKTTAAMKTMWTFLSWGACGNEGIWTINEGVDYPHLAWEQRPGVAISARLSDFLAGSGSEGDPYLIYTAGDIETIASFSCERDKHFRLAFLAGKGTEDDQYLIHTPGEVNLLHTCPYERDACFRLMFMEGEGSEDSPYLISTAEQLNMIGMLPKEWDKHYRLMADIDLSAFDGKDGRPAFHVIGDGSVSCSTWGSGGCWLTGAPFTGVFDGNGHTVSHLTLNSQLDNGQPVGGLALQDAEIVVLGFGYNCVGLFEGLGPEGRIENLGVVDANVTYSDGAAGALVGFNAGTVIQCYSHAVIAGDSTLGGLVGYNSGSLTQCYSTAVITGEGRVGGLVGCSRGTITRCWSAGTVTATSGGAGGLAGGNDTGAITDCYSTATVSGSKSVGGLVGSNTGELSGGHDTVLLGRVSRSYSAGSVSGKEQVGGLVGYSDHRSEVTDCFWDTQVSSQAMSAGGMGQTTAEMQDPNTFLGAGWDFVGETKNGTEDIWWILEGKDYPRLWWETAKK